MATVAIRLDDVQARTPLASTELFRTVGLSRRYVVWNSKSTVQTADAWFVTRSKPTTSRLPAPGGTSAPSVRQPTRRRADHD